MTRLAIDQVLVLNDNYIYLLHDATTGATAAVDPAEAEPVLARLAERGWHLSHILITHHHADHTGGNLALKAATDCTILGAAADAGRIPGLDRGLQDGEDIELGSARAEVLLVPGHTSAHLAYWFAAEQALFCGDTLFSLGCGRLFEGSPAQMWASLERLRALPDDCRVFCAHEYTQSNARFAATVDAANPALAARIAEVETLRAAHKPTVPSLMAEERATNPFLRADQPALAAAVGLTGVPPAEVFAEIRRRKDHFR